MRLTLMGQALMEHDMRVNAPEKFRAMQAHFRQSDACFSNLEIAVLGAGAPTKGEPYFHAADPEILDALREIGISLLALCNNHAHDLGTEGILHTRAQVEQRGIVCAGTGVHIEAAAAPGFLQIPSIALVAMASGGLKPESVATPTRAGVNQLRLDVSRRTFDESDAERNLAAIRSAAQRADVVIAYHHAHHWEPDWQNTPDWQQPWARQCIDAGATIYIAHGVPILHGVEIYREKPIFYSLGNWVFHTKTDPGHYDHRVWESAIVDMHIDGPQISAIHLHPIALNEMGRNGPAFYRTRGFPEFAAGATRQAILDRWATLSAQYGTRFDVDDARARIA